MSMEQILREESELSELMNRVMASPLKPHLEKVSAIEVTIKDLEKKVGDHRKSLAGIQDSSEQNAANIKKIKNSLEDQFEELSGRIDDLETAILKKHQEQQDALLTSINDGHTQLLDNSHSAMSKIDNCNTSLSKSLSQLGDLEAASKNIELSARQTLISVNAGHDLLKEQTEPIKNKVFLIEEKQNENKKIRAAEYLEQQEKNINMSEAIYELPKTIDLINQQITLTATTKIDALHADLIDILEKNTVTQQQHFLKKLRPVKILLAINFTIMLCLLGLFILQTTKII